MKKNTKKAFTLVELMLSCAFLGTMLIAIAALTIRIVNIYKKGISLRSVNSVGRNIMNDLDRNIGGSVLGAIDINPDASAGSVIKPEDFEEKRKKYYFAAKNDDNTQKYGIFCTGSLAYVWNTAETLKKLEKGESSEAIIIKSTSGGSNHAPRLARINTSGFSQCESMADIEDFSNTVYVEADKYVELISKDESNLAIYDFVVQPAVNSTMTGHAYYNISFVLATMYGGVNIMSNGDFCKGENLEDEEQFSKIGLEYCAVNRFDMVVQQSATNKMREE